MPNRHVVKFSYTNRKHLTVGDLMAFPIVKMGNKTPKTSPSPCTMWTPQSLGLPDAPPQTAALMVEALSHTYAVKSLLVTMARPKFATKSILSRGLIPKPHCLPHPWNRPTYDAKTASGSDPTFFHSALDRQTDRPTDKSSDRQIVHGKI